jgi:hypothetical protein
MMKHLVILLSTLLLLSISWGCNNKEEGDNMIGPPDLVVCFIDSEGQDLLTEIPTIKLVTPTVEYAGDFLSNDVCRVKLFINEEEIPAPNMHVRLLGENLTDEPYKAISFVFWDLMLAVNNESNSAVYTVRCEMVCPYVFGNDGAHTLTGELSRDSEGCYWFQKCRFDGAEALPAYFENGRQQESTYIVRVDRAPTLP